MRKGKFLAVITGILAAWIFGIGVVQAHTEQEETHIFGHVICNGEPVPYVSITVVGTSLGTLTDATGHYILTNVPEGDIEILAMGLGYVKQLHRISVRKGIPQEVDFDLIEDVLQIEQVVVTGDKQAMSRKESSTLISTISPKVMAINNATVLSEGLPFLSGVRVENNCQNCGFHQVRMNGLEGPYSQVLIEGQPIFSGLLGVYGLEMIPANMISRLEVQRGGGSTLYGSSAVAGTVNILLQDPQYNGFAAGFNTSLHGVGLSQAEKIAPEYNAHFNASTVTPNNRSGLSVYGNYRDREPFDAHHDGFSELARLRNIALGTRAFHRFGTKGYLTLNYFHITERRRGGDMAVKPHHEADISESVLHHINCASVNYSHRFREEDELNILTSILHINRDSHYGGAQDLGAYGATKNLSFNVSAQYAAKFDFGGRLTAGVDWQGETLKDTKLGHTDMSKVIGWKIEDNDSIPQFEHVPDMSIANQFTFTIGEYLQYAHTFGPATLTAGIRTDYFVVQDLNSSSKAKYAQFVPVPRGCLLVNLIPDLQLRLNYAMGYRKPQVFDEDLHVEIAAGARRIIHENAPDLKHEVSHSGMLSLDYSHRFDGWAIGACIEGFYTHLLNAFVLDVDEERSDDYEKYFVRSNNRHGAHTYGINTEFDVLPYRNLVLKGGFTWHRAEFLKIEEDENLGYKEFLRSPNMYGFFMANWKVYKGLSLAATLNVTGPMKVMYEGSVLKGTEEEDLRAKDPEVVLVRTTPTFADMGMRLGYDFEFKSSTLSLFTGVKNMFNSWQKDWDLGPDRDSGYSYGPTLPRTVYIGITLGNML